MTTSGGDDPLNNFMGLTGATGCAACAAGYYTPPENVAANQGCIACNAGSMTADINDPATAVFVSTGATACAQCWGPDGADGAPAQYVESCAAVSTLPADIEFCSAVELTGDATAKEASCETAQGAGGNPLCLYTAAAADGERGYADHDSLSSTACRACDVGTSVGAGANGEVVCVDYDECQSNPCENGATCGETGSAVPPYAGYPEPANPEPEPYPGGGFTCQCAHGFSGGVCQLLDECALDPCAESALDVPGMDPAQTPNRFQCPVSLHCTDSDWTLTDSYVCECPSCASVMLSDTTTGLLTDYFSTHPAISRYVASGVVATLTDPSGLGTCQDPTRTGCMEPAALNFDPTAAIPDNSVCTARVYGCMDKRATNYDANANTYDPTGEFAPGTDPQPGDGTDPNYVAHTCKAAYCQSEARCIYTLGDSGDGPGVCAGATLAGVDLEVDRAACEALGADGTAIYQSGVGSDSGSATSEYGVRTSSVCRFEPAEKTLCPYTEGDVNDVSAAHDSDCSCPGNVPALLLEDLSDGPAGAPGLDECADATYGGATVGACQAPTHRLCGEAGTHGDAGHSHDAHHGWAGRTCTDYRDAFICPDGGENGYACNDPNPLWLGDFTCSCAYDDGRYTDSVASTCGTDTVFTDSRAGESDIVVSNYGMTLFLESDATTRNHICRLIHQPADSDCSRGTL